MHVFAAAKQSKYFPLTPIILLNVPATALETPSRQGRKRVFETGAKKCRKSDAKGKLNICRVFCGEGWAPTRAPSRALTRTPTRAPSRAPTRRWEAIFRSNSSCCHCSPVRSYHPSNAAKMDWKLYKTETHLSSKLLWKTSWFVSCSCSFSFFYGTLVQQSTFFSR